ncbi:MAG: diadenylate cyclase CdaA [Selenomonadaceae bacterium]|nr:diadenylate cyclase CdaA [Selenomonadaceae bacterium]
MPFDISFPSQLHGILFTIGILDVIDIIIVAVILYRIYEMLEDTRAITLVKGLLILLSVTVFCSWLNLHVMTWLLQKTLTLLFVALPIVFQPELRRALGHLGEGHFLGKSVFLDDDEARSIVGELAKAAKNLSATKTGALIVIERKMKLNDVSATGIGIDALVTSEFIQNVFVPNTPLHDGAAIIRGKRLIAAGCLLPLTDNRGLSTELGTRHRAAIGLSEQCDAIVLVVSEETGTISIAEDGHIMRHLNIDTLKELLLPAFEAPKMTGIKDIILGWGKKS